MYKKLTILTVLFFLSFISMQGQNIQLIINPKPSPYISDWSNHIETASLIISNATNADIKVKVKTQIFDGTGALVAYNDLSKMPVLDVPPGVTTYHAEDIFPLPAAVYKGKFGNISKTGKIPEDHYQICVSLTNPTTGGPMGTSGTICKLFTIVDYQAPTLITPMNNAAIAEKDSRGLFFRWTPVIPTPPTIATYRLQIWEVLEGQTNMIALRSNKPIIDKDLKGILQTQWPIDFPMPESNRKYVWTITPLDDEDRNLVDGNGFAEPFGFSISNPPDTNKNNRHHDSLNIASTDTLKIHDTITSGVNHEFRTVIDSIKDSVGYFSGTGKTYVDWLKSKVTVSFKAIKVDHDKYLSSGEIIAQYHDDAPLNPAKLDQTTQNFLQNIGQYAGIMVLNDWKFLNGIYKWADDVAHGKLPYPVTYSPNGQAAIKLPLGLEINSGNRVMITSMEFKPGTSVINAVAELSQTINGIHDTLGFLSPEIPFHQNKIDLSTGKLQLLDDITFNTTNGNMSFIFKRPDTTHSRTGCYIKWKDSGFDKFGIDLDVSFTRNWLTPVPDNDTDKVKASFSAVDVASFNDLLLTGNFPKSTIVNSSGIVLEASGMSLDLSDNQNDPNIVFPDNYPLSDQGVDFTGLYIKNLSIDMPPSFKNSSGNSISVAVHNLIIDDMGITMSAKAYGTNGSLISLTSGKLAGMGASLDTVIVDIVSSSLTDAGIKGLIILPFSDPVQANTLNYEATFLQATSTFQLSITPTHAVEASILKGKMTLDPTSNITASLETNGNYTFDIDLNGMFKWDDITLGPIKNVSMELDFEGVGLSKATAQDLTFNIGTWSFASPPKFLAHIPVTIKDIGYATKPKSTNPAFNELVRGEINFNIVCNLSKEVGGNTKMGVVMAIRKPPGHGYEPAYITTEIDTIVVHAALSAVTIDGSIGFFHDSTIYGNGFLGNISVVFKAAKLKIEALVQFGTTIDPILNQHFRYWRVEALVTLPPPGVVFMTGLAFRGFGGGAYQNMYPTLANGGFTFKPLNGNLGFEAKAVIATTPKEQGFNMDVTLLGNFSSSGGLTYLGFGGQFYVGAPILPIVERNKAMVKGSLNVSYDFTTKIFDLSASATVDAKEGGVQILKTPNPVNLALHINGSTNKWYFKCGTPTNLNTIDVLSISLYSYLMMGNDLGTDVPNGFTAGFMANYNSTFPGHPITSPGDGGSSLTTTGKGFALGVGLRMYKDLSSSLPSGTVRDWNFNFNFTAGAELDLALLQYSGSCNGINPVGIRSYRASGNLGFYASIAASIVGTVRNRSTKLRYWDDLHWWSDKSYNICDIRGGGWISGAFPNPVFAQGAIDGYVSLFDDLVAFSFHKTFTYGTDCGAMTQDAGPAVTQQDEADSSGKNMIKYITPTTHYNFPDSSAINVAYNLVPNDVFDVGEQQSDGSSINRTFKMVITTSLKEVNNGVETNLSLQSAKNNLGEYQYYHPFPINYTASNNTVSAIAANGNSGSVSQTYQHSGTNYAVQVVTYPPPPPPPATYPNLPPDIPAPKNNLQPDKTYKFTVTATLMELSGTNPTWHIATKRNGTQIIQTIVKPIETGAQVFSQASTNQTQKVH